MGKGKKGKTVMKNIYIIILIFIVIFAIACRASDKPEMYIASYTVKDGDTLWSIAKRYCPNTMDKREYIYKVKKLNNLPQNTFLLPNVEIKILKEIKNG